MAQAVALFRLLEHKISEVMFHRWCSKDKQKNRLHQRQEEKSHSGYVAETDKVSMLLYQHGLEECKQLENLNIKNKIKLKLIYMTKKLMQQSR